MNRNFIGYGLTIFLYVGSLAMIPLALTAGDVHSDNNLFLFLIIGFAVVFLGLAASLFVWSIREVRKGNNAFRAIILFSGLYLVFVLYRVVWSYQDIRSHNQTYQKPSK